MTSTTQAPRVPKFHSQPGALAAPESKPSRFTIPSHRFETLAPDGDAGAVDVNPARSYTLLSLFMQEGCALLGAGEKNERSVKELPTLTDVSDLSEAHYHRAVMGADFGLPFEVLVAYASAHHQFGKEGAEDVVQKYFGTNTTTEIFEELAKRSRVLLSAMACDDSNNISKAKTRKQLRRTVIDRVLSLAPIYWDFDKAVEEVNRHLGFFPQNHGEPELRPDDVLRIASSAAYAYFVDIRIFVRDALGDAIAEMPLNVALREVIDDVSAFVEAESPAALSPKILLPTRGLLFSEIEDRFGPLVRNSSERRARLTHPAKTLKRAPANIVVGASRFGLKEQKAQVSISPSALLRFVAGDENLSNHLGGVLFAQHPQSTAYLVDAIVKRVGQGLAQLSPKEIAEQMDDDPGITPELVAFLAQKYPKVFGTTQEDTQDKVSYLIARQIASVMENAYPGATLGDIAGFLQNAHPAFSKLPMTINEKSLRILQERYAFMPQWEEKPKMGSYAASNDVFTLVDAASEFLESGRAGALRKAIYGAALENQSGSLESTVWFDGVRAVFSQELFVRVATALMSEFFLEGAKKEGGAALKEGAADLLQAVAARVSPETLNTDVQDFIAVVSEDSPGLAEHYAEVAHAALNLDLRTIQKRLRSLESDALKETRPVLREARRQAAALCAQFEGIKASVQRDVFANQALKRSLRNYALIPIVLEALQNIVAEFSGQKPFANHHVLFVQHGLGQAYPQVDTFVKLGMDPKKAIFVEKPYHESKEVEQAIEHDFGVDVRNPGNTVAGFDEACSAAVDDLVKAHRLSGERMLIICDGPGVRDYFQDTYPELLDQVDFTEQTSFGDRPEMRAQAGLHVVSYARDELKQIIESRYIAQSVVRNLNLVLHEMGTGYEEKPVLVRAFGKIGEEVARALKHDGARVAVYDPKLDAQARAKLRSEGFVVFDDPQKASEGQYLQVGCSGYESIGVEEIQSSENGAILASASSKQKEVAVAELEALATDENGRVRKFEVADINGQKTQMYWLNDGSVRVLVAEGYPNNFYDVNSVPPELIALTMSLSVLSAIQAVSGEARNFQDLSEPMRALAKKLCGAMVRA